MYRQTFPPSFFTKETDTNMPELVQKDVTELKKLNISIEMVKKKQDSLKINKSPGPDLLYRILLRELCRNFSKLGFLWYRYAERRCANITALFKKDDKKYVRNYHSVSLTIIVR